METIEITRVDEAAAQRLADATGRVTYLYAKNVWNGQSFEWPKQMTTDRNEAVAWGESVAFVPQQNQSLPENKSLYWQEAPEVRVYRKGFDGEWKEVPAEDTVAEDVRRAYLSDSEPPPQLRVVRVLEYRGPQSWMEKALANSWVSETEPRHGKGPGGAWEIVEQIRTTERLCRWCGGEHLEVCSEDECSGNPRKGRY